MTSTSLHSYYFKQNKERKKQRKTKRLKNKKTDQHNFHLTNTTQIIKQKKMTKNQILGYILLHRHGQRAPIRNIYNNINEVNIWNSFLPNNLILNNLDEKYPTKRDLNIKEQYDLKIKPFSCLTLIGINYMINIGKQVKEKFPLINKGKIINVYSTNYHRTQVKERFIIIIMIINISSLIIH